MQRKAGIDATGASHQTAGFWVKPEIIQELKFTLTRLVMHVR